MFKICVFVLLVLLAVTERAFAGTSLGITCPAAGTSIQVLPARGTRLSYAFINDSAIDVRIGNLAGTSTANLDDTNSVIIKAGAALSDSYPGNDITRVVCMSTTAGTAVVHVKEVVRP